MVAEPWAGAWPACSPTTRPLSAAAPPPPRPAARFVRMCDAFGVPLVILLHVPGYRPGGSSAARWWTAAPGRTSTSDPHSIEQERRTAPRRGRDAPRPPARRYRRGHRGHHARRHRARDRPGGPAGPWATSSRSAVNRAGAGRSGWGVPHPLPAAARHGTAWRSVASPARPPAGIHTALPGAAERAFAPPVHG